MDMGFEKLVSVHKISNETIQDNLEEVNQIFNEFLAGVDVLLNSEVDSTNYRNAQQKILLVSNELRNKSNKIVDLYNRIANENQNALQIPLLFLLF